MAIFGMLVFVTAGIGADVPGETGPAAWASWMDTAAADGVTVGSDPVCAAIDPSTATVTVYPENCVP